jgi:hypothetical protein
VMEQGILKLLPVTNLTTSIIFFKMAVSKLHTYLRSQSKKLKFS